MSIKESKTLLNDLSFCVIDLETTGGNHQTDKIIEVGMVIIKNLKVVAELSFLINPQKQIPDFIQKLTNISQNDVKSSPIIEDVIEELVEFIGDKIIVAHNTSFDVPFMNSVLSRLKMDKLKNKVICTNVMTKHLIPEILNSNLNYMSRLFNIKHSKAHRALDDAKATAELLLIFLGIFIEKGIKKINQLYYPRNKFELDRIHFSADDGNEKVVNYVKKIPTSTQVTIKGERGLILAVIPLEHPESEVEFLAKILEEADWKLITISLMKPMLEGIFQFNNHYLKYPESIRIKIKNFLENKYQHESSEVNIDSLDFVVVHHLITDQVIVYSFLHLNTNHKYLFKIPAQKKKMFHYMLTQVAKFEGEEKGKRKNIIHKDLVHLVEKYLTLNKGKNEILFIDRKSIRDAKDSVLKITEEFALEDRSTYHFPKNFLS